MRLSEVIWYTVVTGKYIVCNHKKKRKRKYFMLCLGDPVLEVAPKYKQNTTAFPCPAQLIKVLFVLLCRCNLQWRRENNCSVPEASGEACRLYLLILQMMIFESDVFAKIETVSINYQHYLSGRTHNPARSFA